MKKLRILNMGNPNSFKNDSICKYFINKGHEVFFIGQGISKNPLPGMKYFQLKNQVLNIPKVKFIELILQTKNIIKKIKPDILHAHNNSTYGWLGAFSGFNPLIIQCFGGDIFGLKNSYKKLTAKYSLKKADQIIVTGKHMINTLEKDFKVNSSCITLLPRGIDLTIYKPYDNKGEFKERYELKPGPIVFSPRYLIDDVYNIDIIIKSVPLVKEYFPDINYIQLLKKPSEQKILDDYHDLIKNLNIEDNFKFIPVVDNDQMPYFFNASDVCISIPSYDGFPVSVIEGSACGKSFIVSDVPYTTEWFENGKHGVILNALSPEALAKETVFLLTETELRIKMGENVRQKVKLEYDYHKCMENLEHIYFSLA